MQMDYGLFPLHFKQLPKQLFAVHFQSSCQLFIRKLVHKQQAIQSLENQEFQNYPILLALSGQYVLQLFSQTKEIKSGFKCDFDIKFWIIRAPSIGNNIMGKVQGIAFQFQLQNETQTVSLFVDQEDKGDKMKDLQHFASVLERKYIVQKQFHEKYKAIKRIGKGVTACVYSSLCLLDKSQVAIKSFKKQVYFTQDNGNGKKGFLKQFKILTQLSCKYLSKLLGVYESDHSIYIVLQLLDRTLYNYLQRFSFPETTQCRRMLYQLLIGLRYLHKKNIMHRDIKLENIMIRGAGKDNVEPVIVDFGLAEYTDATEFVYIRCGTPGYVAPQIINLSRQQKTQIKYDKACDIFSLGVIFHILLLGKTVFEGEDMRAVVQSNKQCNIDYEFKSYSRLSPEIKDLLSGMLRKQPKSRYTVEQLMNHAFFREQRGQFASQVNLMDREHFGNENVKTQIQMVKE